MKTLGFLFLLLTGLSLGAQEVLNTFKYVIVPTQFEGFRSENQYQTSTLVKYYLSEKGMDVHYDNAIPDELNTDRCSALYISLDDQSSMFSTKVAVVFKDCQGKEVFRTKVGNSRVKQYNEAYRQALEEAFTTLRAYVFKYQKPEAESPVVLNFGNDVKKLPPTPKPDPVPSEVTQAVEEARPDSRDKEETALVNPPEVVVEAISLPDAVAAGEEGMSTFPSVLYAQKTETGYQLVDTVPSIQFYLMETSLPNVYLAQRKGQNGILFLKDDRWIFEYYKGADRMQEILQIKF